MSKSASTKKVTTIKQVIDNFLLSCKVEGKAYRTIECYSDKLKGFPWYPQTLRGLDLPSIVVPLLKVETQSR